MREFIHLVQLAYSAERAAAFAYFGHSSSVKDPIEKCEIKNIENEEWLHRGNLKRILSKLGRKPSFWYEIKYFLIGKLIGAGDRILRKGISMGAYFELK